MASFKVVFSFHKNFQQKSKSLFPLKIHVRTVHEKVKSFMCDLCSKAFSHSSHLKAHTHTDTDLRNFKCKLCPKAFHSGPHLKNHVEAVHNNVRPFLCELCSRAFKKHSHLKDHVDTVHNNLRPYECATCFKAFSQVRDLKTHVSTVHEKSKPLLGDCYYCVAGLPVARPGLIQDRSTGRKSTMNYFGLVGRVEKYN